MTAAALGLGGNIGDTRSLMAAAIDHLARNPNVVIEGVSALYRTPPWGKTDQPPFLNAAIRIETQLLPMPLLMVALKVEKELGRERAERWGPRTIDIDILVYGNEAVDQPGLRIPHPRLKERAFALAPLVDVMPEAMVSGVPASEWLTQSDRAGMERLAEPGWQRQLQAHGGHTSLSEL